MHVLTMSQMSQITCLCAGAAAAGHGIDLVHTQETLATLSLIAPWLKNKEPFILVG